MTNANWRTGIQKVKGFNATVQLILINCVLFLAINITANVSSFDLGRALSVQGNLAELGTTFYTVITYMFTHESLGHIFFNMLLFYFTGQILSSILNEKRLWFIYIMGGICGALFFLILSNIFFVGQYSYLLGASASVTAVSIAAAIYAPNLPVSLFIFGPFPLKWVVLVLFLLSTVIDLSVNTGGKVAHLGGAFFGMAYAWQLKKGNDWLRFLSFKPRQQAKVYQMSSTQKKVVSEEKTLNEILDKINRSGYDSLTKQEKETLQKIASKK